MYKKTIERLGAVLCAVGILCWTSVLLLMNTFAADGSVNLTVECRTLWGKVLPNEQWDIYKVAEVQSDGTYGLYGDFAQYSVSLEDVSASGLAEAAETLENYAILDRVSPLASGRSDDNGSLCFFSLDDGLYLLSGKAVEVDGVIYTPSPFLVNVSYDGSGEIMDLYAYPKYKIMSTMEDDQYTVVKKFGNKAAEPKDPNASIAVEIYCDGELYETVQLNKDNDWTYSWYTDGYYYDWRVKEVDVPQGCTVKYSTSGATLIITNTMKTQLPGQETVTTTTTVETSEETTTTTVTETSGSEQTSASTSSSTVSGSTVTTSERLPQTGQLWWPIPILGAGGMLFMSVGLMLRSKGRE